MAINNSKAIQLAESAEFSAVAAGSDLGWLPPTGGWERLSNILRAIGFIAAALLLLTILVDGLRTHGRKAWLPLTPGLVLIAVFATGLVGAIFPKLAGIFFPLSRGGFLCVPLTVLVIFLMRFTQQERENAHMTSELEAARSVCIRWCR